ncbi:hypothetical protein [Nostoc sp. DedQUE09]
MAIISVTNTSIAVNPLKQSQTVGAVLAFGLVPIFVPDLSGVLDGSIEQ